MAVDPNIKILIADDSGTMRIMFKQILKQAEFENIIMAINEDDGATKVMEENRNMSIDINP